MLTRGEARDFDKVGALFVVQETANLVYNFQFIQEDGVGVDHRKHAF